MLSVIYVLWWNHTTANSMMCYLLFERKNLLSSGFRHLPFYVGILICEEMVTLCDWLDCFGDVLIQGLIAQGFILLFIQFFLEQNLCW